MTPQFQFRFSELPFIIALPDPELIAKDHKIGTAKDSVRKS